MGGEIGRDDSRYFFVKNRFDNSFFFISELALGDQVTGIAGLKTQLQVSVL